MHRSAPAAIMRRARFFELVGDGFISTHIGQSDGFCGKFGRNMRIGSTVIQNHKLNGYIVLAVMQNVIVVPAETVTSFSAGRCCGSWHDNSSVFLLRRDTTGAPPESRARYRNAERLRVRYRNVFRSKTFLYRTLGGSAFL